MSLRHPELCCRTCSPQSTCNACRGSCPVNAVSLSPTLAVDSGCIGCGICVAACPNGVFESAQYGEDYWAVETERFLGSAAAGRVVFQCGGREVSADALRLPCLAGLTETVVMAALQQGARAVEFRHYDCRGCSLFRTEFNFFTTFQQLRELLPLVGRRGDDLKVVQLSGPVPFAEDVATAPAAPAGDSRSEPMSRRELFSFFKRGVRRRVRELSEIPRAPVTSVGEPLNRKRLRLLEILDSLAPFQPHRVAYGLHSFCDIHVSADCIGCKVCVTVCPVGALKRSVSDGKLRLDFNPRQCTRCGLCEAVCMPKAISCDSAFELHALLTTERRRLIELPEKTCELCRQPFYSDSETICSFCAHQPRW